MDLSGMSARVRLNMKRSLLESQGDRSKQRRVMEDPDEDEVMIGEVQVNEEVEHPMSEVSVAEFDGWQQKEYEGILSELQSQNDFMSFHGVPSSEVANKDVIKTRWVMKPQGEGVKARLVMQHFNTCKDENNDFSTQEHQLQCRSIWFSLWQQNASRWESHKQSLLSLFPLHFFIQR